MNEADNYQDAVNGRRVADVVAQHTATMSDSLSKPMFLSDQFEAYLKVVEMELDGRIQRLVDLRSLHEKLGVRDNYRDWAPRSLTNSRSVEGVHYISRVDPRNVGRPSKEYHVCFEKVKIIAARSNAENSLDICEWLDRLMIQDAVAQAVVSVPVMVNLVSPQPSTDIASTMKSVLSFAFDGHDIRVVRDESNEPWFVASDVCNALDIAQAHAAVRRLDADDCNSTTVVDSVGRLQENLIISQSGLFELVASSRKPQAKPFRKWVFGTVLPSIAKTGTYSEAPAPALSRIELLEMALAAERRAEAERQRADDAMRKALGLETKIATSTLYPKVTPEPGKAHISIKDIKAEYAPYLSEPKIRLVLRFYGQGRTRFQFGAHENASFQTFQRAGLEEVFDEFLKDCQHRLSGSRTSVILDHECFDGETARVPKNLAIEHLGYAEDDFAS